MYMLMWLFSVFVLVTIGFRGTELVLWMLGLAIVFGLGYFIDEYYPDGR